MSYWRLSKSPVSSNLARSASQVPDVKDTLSTIAICPAIAGLFQRAISESGSYLEFQDYFDYIVPLAQAETTGTLGVPAGTTAHTAQYANRLAAKLFAREVIVWRH
jgi:hypothetical protein